MLYNTSRHEMLSSFLAHNVQLGEEDCLLVFPGSLSALVYQHSITPISLPCALRIPEKGKQDSNRKHNSGTVLQRSNLILPCYSELGTHSAMLPHLFQHTQASNMAVVDVPL